MNADLEHLIVLQAQDLEINRLRQLIAAGPEKITGAESALAAAQHRERLVKESLLAEDKLRRSHESDVATHRTKRKRLQGSLETAANAAQIAAYENEIGFAAAAIERLETEEYASLERSEQLEAERNEATAQVGQQTAALEATRKGIAQEVEQGRTQLTGLQQQRDELRQQVEPARLAQYDRISKLKGTALAEALGTATAGRCAACQMAVRPQRWLNLTGRAHDDEIFPCESCGRMLFWDPRRDTPRAWETGDRLHRAQGLGTGASS